MKIKVGDYIRTETGYIGKVKEIRITDFMFCLKIFYCDYNEEEEIFEDDITKHSPNIIDLVEVGDYVNAYRVNSIEKEYYNLKLDKVMPLKEKELIVGNEEGLLRIVAKDIKTILPHELYEKNCYKVGGEDE